MPNLNKSADRVLIELFIKPIIGSIDTTSLNISIDNSIVEYTVVENSIRIELTTNHGFHMLSITRNSPVRFDITDVRINGSGIRHFLYLSWVDNKTEKIQPCTEIWEDWHVWNLPFGIPISNWIECVLDNIQQGLIGKNLYKHYQIFYPQSLELPDTYPNVVRDFFKFNHTFTAVANDDNIKKLPYAELNVDREKLSALSDSSVHHFNNKTFFHLVKTPHQAQYNEKEDSLWSSSHWMSVDVAEFSKTSRKVEFKVSRAEWPELHDVLDILQLKDFDIICVVYLSPGAYLSPHRDRILSADSVDANGLGQLYIPLHYKEGNLIKFGKAGILNGLNGPVVINNANFTHSAVNMSDEIRSVLTCRCDINSNKHLLKYL